ncbi:type II toxin-antitoxin system VapC family toxin [Lyngbya sp. CCAP 1446/10]|uniref:type II toxin-antitoxin system VapC family toxin n=1 Tax=Lyngbya sp. CCAP 1446/10 TaxID=439293 RepID=UPI0022386F64|nr:type II toxin-antitoxin system VapC family toxin [Lyngbya sp. CCAP 1446/10]MCW6048988.1 type II toxin-antitoxin system VapC family toxin [Lyngbya sp. CCAP 1446/10]
MTLRYLLDTNIISEPVRPIPNANVMTKLIEAKSTVAIASVVWHEILLGCYRMPDSKRRRAIEAYLEEEVKVKLPILPYTQEAAEWFARERARLIAIGQTPSYADGQIAAIAKVNNLILVTRNIADYANFQDLPIENWFS